MENVHNHRARQYYANNATTYPTEIPTGEPYKDYVSVITDTCKRSPEKISVLELGSGTGRFFHHLTNVKRLVGVDISKDMLDVARENLKNMPELEPVTELVLSRIEDFNSPEKFDFIYSIGTIGEFLAFDQSLLKKMLSFLKPGGVLFFTLVDIESFEDKEYVGPLKKSIRLFLKFLPKKLRLKSEGKFLVNADWKNLWMTRAEAEAVLNSSPIPIHWELGKTRDRLHVHHICKIRLK
jgi:SAM-dependent methyltransferase